MFWQSWVICILLWCNCVALYLICANKMQYMYLVIGRRVRLMKQFINTIYDMNRQFWYNTCNIECTQIWRFDGNWVHNYIQKFSFLHCCSSVTTFYYCYCWCLCLCHLQLNGIICCPVKLIFTYPGIHQAKYFITLLIYTYILIYNILSNRKAKVMPTQIKLVIRIIPNIITTQV